MQSRIIFIKKSMRYRTEGTIPFTINKILLIFIWAADIIFFADYASQRGTVGSAADS